MPRKSNVLTVTAWPKLTDGKLYRGKVKGARVDRTQASHRLHVVIENLEPDQRGRGHELDLLLPVHPGSRTALLFVACGIDASEVGARIDLDRIADVVVGMRFRRLGTDNIAEFDFEPISNRPAPAGADSSAAELGGGDTRRRA